MKVTTQDPTTWCEIVTDFSRLEELSPEWRRWAQCDSRTDIFQHWGWARAFWRAYSGAVSLCTPVVHQQDRVLGILPLVRRGERIELLGSPESDYNDVLCDEHSAAVVLEAALDSLLRLPVHWTSCVLDNVPAHSRMVRCLPQLPPRLRTHLQLAFRYPSPTIRLDNNKEEVLKRLMGIKDLRSHHKKLQKLGHVTFRHIEARGEAREHLSHLFDQHIARFAMNGLRSQFLASERREFYEALIEELDPRTELRFAVLELDSRPVAYHLGFQQDGKFIHYKPTFDVSYWDCAPGDVLLLYLFQYALKAPISEFDFSIGDESYKRRFANDVKPNYALYLDRSPRHWRCAFERIGRHAVQTIRQHPDLKRVLKRAAQRLDQTLSQVVRFVTNGGLLRRCINGLRAAYRSTIWARDEVLFFSCALQTVRGGCGIDVSPERLDELARLSVEYPEFLNETRLRYYRGRLKRGDQVFTTRDGSGGVCMVWVGRRTEISIPELGKHCRLPLPTTAFVIYDHWTSPQFSARGVLDVFRAIVGQCEGMELWTYCFNHQRALCRAIEEADFRLRRRLRYRALLHWFRRTWIASAP